MRKILVTLQKAISNSSVKEDELGTILYFVSKNGREEVVSMAKIETKEALALSYLVKALKLFWKNHEKLNSWNKIINAEYNNVFKSYILHLEGLKINDFEGYKIVGQQAFKQLKDDVKLYTVLKKNIPNFLSIIYKQVGYEGRSFVSSVLNYLNDESDQSNSKKEVIQEKKIKGETKEKPRKEDAIDRIMKNEYIRKSSKIDYENDPLEDIIGSQKNEKGGRSSVLKKYLHKKKKKSSISSKNKKQIEEEELKTPKISTLNTQKEKTPEKTKDLDFKEIENNTKTNIDPVEEQTPHPLVDIPSKTEQVLGKEPEDIEEKKVKDFIKNDEVSAIPDESQLIDNNSNHKSLLPSKI